MHYTELRANLIAHNSKQEALLQRAFRDELGSTWTPVMKRYEIDKNSKDESGILEVTRILNSKSRFILSLNLGEGRVEG